MTFHVNYCLDLSICARCLFFNINRFRVCKRIRVFASIIVTLSEKTLSVFKTRRSLRVSFGKEGKITSNL